MTGIVWKNSKNLGLVAENSFFEKKLESTGAKNILYTVISGELPTGISLSDNGTLGGVPRILEKNKQESNAIYKFTVRALGDNSKLADRTFHLTVSAVQAPVVELSFINLGTYYDGTYFVKQLTAVDEHIGSNLTWKLVEGRLPPGIHINSQGLLEGVFYQNKVPNDIFINRGWDRSNWDNSIYDFVRQQEDSYYNFLVEVSDGEITVKQSYSLQVIARDFLTADVSEKTVDQTDLVVNVSQVHLPFVTTRSGYLPEIKPSLARQDTYFAFQFEGLDFDNDDLYFEITSPDELGFDQFGSLGWDIDGFDSSQYPMPMYLGLNNRTGWYTGQIAEQIEYKKDYFIQIFCRKPYNQSLSGNRNNFIVSVLGRVDEVINWITPEDLGSIDNGLLSILSVKAVHNKGLPLFYKLKSNGSRIPQGIMLTENGMLSGRVSFNYFQFDEDQTTFDKNKTTFHKVFSFTVVAYTENQSAYSEKTFRLTVNCVNKKPFENLYLKGFPDREQRILFESILENQVLFPDELIYRSFDPYYGKAKDLRFLFLPGINPKLLSVYAESLSRNHFTKTVLFGDIKTATAYNENLQIEYEVVYLDIIDEGESFDKINRRPIGPAQTINLTKNKNKFSDGINEYIEYTPNSLTNMSNRISAYIGVANNNTLPGWMTSPQPDSDTPGKFLPPLGFIRAAVLAYTVPGGSSIIAHRLRSAKILFNRIPFKTDRYQLDNWLTKNYDIFAERFYSGEQTTIDLEPSVAEKFRDLGFVDYVVSTGFDDIDGNTLEQINLNRLIDGSDGVLEGDTIIFYQQDNFPSYINDYYDYIERGTPNLRPSVFKIEIVGDNLVNLKLIRTTDPGDIVTVLKGVVYKDKKMYFEAYTEHGQVPQWWFFEDELIPNENMSDSLIKPHQETTFDKNATKFFSNRDHFADLDTTGKYIKFPKNGVFI